MEPEPVEAEQVEILDSGSREVALRAEIDVQVATAHRFPRSITKFREEAKSLVTANIETAESCFYVLERENKKTGQKTLIPGPSIRLAEIAASCWQNLRVQTRIFAEGADTVVAQALVHDLERNVAISQEVPRRIVNKFGKRYSVDLITLTALGAQSIALRNAVFRVIPRTYIDQLYNDARRVAVGDQKTLGERRQRMVQWATKAGIPTPHVYARLGVKGIDDIGLEELEIAIGLANAIKEGTMTIEEAFPEPKEETEAEEKGKEEEPKLPKGKRSGGRKRGQSAKTKTEPESSKAAEPPTPEEKKPEDKPKDEPRPRREIVRTTITELADTGNDLEVTTQDGDVFPVDPDVFEDAEKLKGKPVDLIIEHKGRGQYLRQIRPTTRPDLFENEEGDAT